MKKLSLLLLTVLSAAMILTACSSQKKSAAKSKGVSLGSTASLTNTYWKLSTINGQTVETPDNAKEVHIKFANQENRFQGFAGCNGLGGSYELTANKGIKIRALSTKMYCDRMEVENFLTNAVTKANNYTIEGEKLMLYDGKNLLVSFDSVYF